MTLLRLGPALPTVLRTCTTSGVPGSQLLDPENLWRLLAAFTPENAIIVNEAATTGSAWSAVHAFSAAPHTVLGLTGGAIGLVRLPTRWALPSHPGPARRRLPGRRKRPLHRAGTRGATCRLDWGGVRVGETANRLPNMMLLPAAIA